MNDVLITGSPISDILQEVNITVFESEACTRGYSTLLDFNRKFPTGIKPETHLCAGDELGGKDACQVGTSSYMKQLYPHKKSRSKLI